MHRYLIGSAIALFHVTASATPHNINLLPRPPQSSPGPSPPSQPPPVPPNGPSCLDPSVPRSFSFHEIAYLRYEVSPFAPSPQPNTTQLVFELVNENTGISTGCACQNVMRGGTWVDDSRTWYACVDRAIAVGDARYPVKTSALVDWDVWRLTVNQTWVCDESATTISQLSALTLAPTCMENTSAFQYIKECTAPDIVVSATPGES